MTFHAVETRCLWLEFAGGAAGDHGLSDPFSFIRLVDRLIEGGEQHELIASLRGGRWVLAADESIHITRIRGLGVFSVHMEQMDGSDASLECTKMQVDGTLLLVDGRPVAYFDESRNGWRRIGTDTRLHGIRLEPDGATLLSSRGVRIRAGKDRLLTACTRVHEARSPATVTDSLLPCAVSV